VADDNDDVANALLMDKKSTVNINHQIIHRSQETADKLSPSLHFSYPELLADSFSVDAAYICPR
jgi:hypothetical protein